MAETKKTAKAPDKGGVKPELKAVGKDEPQMDGDDAAAAMMQDGGGKLSKKKLIAFTLLPILFVAAVGAGAYYMGYLDKFISHKKIDCTTVTEGDKDYAACAQEIAQTAASMPPGVFEDVPDMIVNLNAGPKSPPRFLKIALKVELESKDDKKSFEAIMPRVVDQFQTYLRELRIDDLKGSSGMYRMKIELLSRVRAAAPDIKVRDVLFQEILVQ